MTHSPAAHNNLALALKLKGDIEGSIAEYRESLPLKAHPERHINFGGALLMKSDIDPAIAEFRKAVRPRPDDAKTHRVLALALMKKGQSKPGLEELLSGCQLDPKDPDLSTLCEGLSEVPWVLRLLPPPGTIKVENVGEPGNPDHCSRYCSGYLLRWSDLAE